MTKQQRRALTSGILGNSIEYYEFVIYGLAAALVFPKVFFPELTPAVGTIVSLATFAGAYVARPVGALFFGHFGDKLGRRRALIVTLLLMGGSTFLIGLLPSAAQIGSWAAVLLLVLRLVQGFSLGGEYGGAILMAVEHAFPERRTLFGAISASGLGWGSILANLLFLALRATLTEEQFLAWGWRVPFLLSALLVGVCLYVRSQLEESPEFEVVQEVGAVKKAPIREILGSTHGFRLLGIIIMIAGAGSLYNVVNVFSLSYGQDRGLDTNVLLIGILALNVMAIIGYPFWGWVADRTGQRRKILIGAYAVVAITPWIWFPMINTGGAFVTILAFVLIWIPHTALNGLLATTMAHIFPPNIRYTGVSVGFQGGSLLGSATAPLVAAWLFNSFGTWQPIAAYLTAGLVIATFAVYLTRERFETIDVESVTAESEEKTPSLPSTPLSETRSVGSA
ncbi:MFS transporter [Rhodococcus erythropolis]|uniref:MFS transporter n=1 Tax=Rhodococcus erythropolis TaxID=1833 RepID=UPI002225D5D9|nr:MFS transporter [Rhodococcus erythropolis]MCW2295438.1 MFS family permease [Rhodococcus erythropolis]